MSGFAAAINLDGAPIADGLLDEMAAFLAFRGPDARQIHAALDGGLVHTLLAIPGESDGDDQPFTLDGCRWIAGDIRLYARDALASAIAARDPRGCTSEAPDIELLARAYAVWGEDCVMHLLGDFSFVVWDAPRRTLFAARDHLGVKPCFYARLGHSVIVSNTLDCIRIDPRVSRELHEPAVADFLLFGVNRDRRTTIFRDIQRLPPAHRITWSTEGVRQTRYWTLPVEPPLHLARAGDYVDRFAAFLETAVRDRVRTRSVSVLLSGGLDSSTLTATAHRVLRAGSQPFFLQAITSVYDRLIPHHDRKYADLVAAFLQIPIRYDVRDDETSMAEWQEVDVHTPEPVANPPGFVAGVASLKRLAPPTRVLLYGEGPDDALRYEWRPYLAYLVSKRRPGLLVRAAWQNLSMHPRLPLWSSIRQIAGARRTRQRWTPTFPDWLNPDFVARCGCLERWAAAMQPAAASDHPIRPRAYDDMHAIQWQALFDDCDMLAANAGAEYRHPFVDVRLLQYLLRLPATPWCRNKHVIRRAMAGSLPREVVWRKKSPLSRDPDLERVRTSGLPRAAPSSTLLRYVNPGMLPRTSSSDIALRAVLRPLGFAYWLQRLDNMKRPEVQHGIENAVSRR